jgi:hypothetical protein
LRASLGIITKHSANISGRRPKASLRADARTIIYHPLSASLPSPWIAARHLRAHFVPSWQRVPQFKEPLSLRSLRAQPCVIGCDIVHFRHCALPLSPWIVVSHLRASFTTPYRPFTFVSRRDPRPSLRAHACATGGDAFLLWSDDSPSSLTNLYLFPSRDNLSGTLDP